MDSPGPPPIASSPDHASSRTKEKPLSGSFQRRSLIDQVKKHLCRYPGSHAALSERVVLYGGSGIGKFNLMLTTSAAKEITAADGRRILWVNGHTFITFIRDYCGLYHELTGSHLPRKLGLNLTLSKVRHVLEERRQEWLLVITDLGAFMDDEPKLTPSLPARGQILITSHDMIDVNPQLGIQFSDGVICALKAANGAKEIFVVALTINEVQELARELCPSLLNIWWHDFGDLQRWARASPLFLKMTMMNLQLLRLDFSDYRRLFEKQFHHVKLHTYPRLLWYSTACHLASQIFWDALADHDTWAQRLLRAMAMVPSHPAPLRLLERLSVFSRTHSDHFSPALDLLTSLGVVITSNLKDDLHISIFHHDFSRWLAKHIRRGNSDLEENQRLITVWADLLDKELKATAPVNPDVCYSPDTLWSVFPLINDLVTAAPQPPFYTPPASQPLLDLLINSAETILHAHPLIPPIPIYVDQSNQMLFAFRRQLTDLQYQTYTVRIKHIRVQIHLAAGECAHAASHLRMAKRTMKILEVYERDDPGSGVYNDLSLQPGPTFYGHTGGYPVLAASSSPGEDNPFTAKPTICKESGIATQCSLLALRRRTEDLEIQVLIIQRHFASAWVLLRRLLLPSPSATSLSDPYTLAQRYFWASNVAAGHPLVSELPNEALRYSHACMTVWAKLSAEEQWGNKGQNIRALHWVDAHVENLLAVGKLRGAMLFLPKLLDAWLELIPGGGAKGVFLAKKLVECYVKLDQVKQAESVVVRILEIMNGRGRGVGELSGLDDPNVGAPIDEQIREMLWHMLIELARGYKQTGSVVVAEGLVRYCLGSWRRSVIGTYEPIEIVDEPGASEEQLQATRRFQREETKKARQQFDERERTWERTAPLLWWNLLSDMLVMQGKFEEARRLVEKLTSQSKPLPRDMRVAVNTPLQQRATSYRQMCDVYQRGIWAEEDGYRKEWKMLVGGSREQFLLRRAVKEFGSIAHRVRDGRDFSSDLDLHLISHAKRSKVLHLLDRDWSHSEDGTFVSRTKWNVHGYVPDVRTSPTISQRHLYQFWRWCRCRNRTRAWSLGYAEYVDKRLIREDDEKEQRPKPMKQTKLDSWVYVVVDIPNPYPRGCRPDCPCINANVAGLADQAAIEASLWLSEEPVRSHLIHMPKSTARYRRLIDRPPCNEISLRELSPERPSPNNVWTWTQPEFGIGDADEENYIIPHALDIPTIKINVVGDAADLEDEVEARDSHSDMSTREEANAAIPSSAASALPEPPSTKKQERKRKDQFGRECETYFTQDIKDYLTIDDEARARILAKEELSWYLDQYQMRFYTGPIAHLENELEGEDGGGAEGSGTSQGEQGSGAGAAVEGGDTP